jgi:hypothetical protein
LLARFCDTQSEIRSGRLPRRAARLGTLFPQRILFPLDHNNRLQQGRALVKREMGWSFPIFSTVRCDPSLSMPFSERRTRFRIPKARPQESAPLLKINPFGVASLACEPVRALDEPGYDVLLGLKFKGARSFTF